MVAIWVKDGLWKVFVFRDLRVRFSKIVNNNIID